MNYFIKKKSHIFLTVIILLIAFGSIFINSKDSMAEETVNFGQGKEKVYNIDHVLGQSKIRTFAILPSSQTSKTSLKSLKGKLITSDGGRVVRLASVEPDGKVLVNEGPNPNVVTLYSSASQATKQTISKQSISLFSTCSDTDYIDLLESKYGVPRETLRAVQTNSGKRYLNLNVTRTKETRLAIYGGPSDVPGNHYDTKTGEHEYLGFNENGGFMINDKYPPDEYTGWPSLSLFKNVRNFAPMADGGAKEAWWLPGVYTGDANYSKAVNTISYFRVWGANITSKKPASWWLDKSYPRIKLQGLLDKYKAGLGITEYKSPTTGKNWYQTYMVVPSTKLPATCESTDVRATSVKATRSSSTNVTVSFYITNNDPDKASIKFPSGGLDWSLNWKFNGIDTKGNPVSKSGSFSGVQSYFTGTYLYGTVYHKSYVFSPKLPDTWAGKITVTANFNPTHKLQESTYSNNDASNTLNWEPTPPDSVDDINCTPEKPEITPRYDYQMDFSVNKIEAKTVDSGSPTQTPVTVERKDFSANRTNAENGIQSDLNAAYALRDQYQNEVVPLQEIEDAALRDISIAEAGHEVCTTDPVTGKESCSIVVNDAEVQSANNALTTAMNNIALKVCQVKSQENWISAYQKEWNNLVDDENQYKYATTDVVLRDENGNEIGKQSVTLKEGDIKTLNFNWLLTDSGIVEGEIDPEENFPEITFENNRLATPIYIASFDSGNCGLNSTVSGVVKTVTTPGGTTEYKETLSGQLLNQSKTEMRAGTGFSFDVQTHYVNDDPESNSTGVSSANSYFPTLVNYLPYPKTDNGYEVKMDKMSSSGTTKDQTLLFGLPKTYVEQYSGNVFDAKYNSNPNLNLKDTILDGGRKWYVDFNQPDGAYDFMSTSDNVGTNHLSICLNSNVTVNGTIVGDQNGNDDFVKREINANHPFNGGTGWNWKGNESIITGLKDWYNNWPYNDPTKIPSSLLYKSIKLDRTAINAIQEYNKSHGQPTLGDDFSTIFP